MFASVIFLFYSFLSTLQKLYRSDLNYLRGTAWIATGALQIEGSKKATDLISEVRYPLCFFIYFLPFLVLSVHVRLPIFTVS